VSQANDRESGGETPVPSEEEFASADTSTSHVDVSPVTDDSREESSSFVPSADLIGTVVADRYRVQRMLGRGGMGAVFQAEHVHMKKLVALKVLHVHMSDNREVVARFEREAVAAGRLQHPGIVAATDFGSLPDGSFYLALELVDGMSLADALKEDGAFTLERALSIAFQVNSALCAAHAAGIVHRDLKPDNVMLARTEDTEDFVKVLDFGIAKIRLDGDHQEGLTRAGLVFGTPEYMSPEQAMGHEADARSDLYCVGMLMYEMLAGCSPFSHEDLTAMLTAQITEPPPPLPDSIPTELANLVMRLLEKEPEKRPNSADELTELFFVVSEKLGLSLPVPRTAAGTRMEILRRSSVDQREIESPNRPSLVDQVQRFSMQPLSIGRKKVPLWLPAVALAFGGALGAFFMLTNEEVIVPPEKIAEQEQVDAEAQLLADARSGDRDAVAELRKLVILKQKELEEAGLLVEPQDEAAEAEAKKTGAVKGDAKKAEAKSGQDELKGAVPSKKKTEKQESAASKSEGSELRIDQANRYLALGRGYSVIKHSVAALEMYREAVKLDAHLSEDPELLIDVRVALGAHDAVEEGLDFALESLGAHGADLIYDVYLDHLGEAGMTPVVARAMKLVKGARMQKQATPELQVALRLQKAKYCAEFRDILPTAVRAADDRSLQKLRALKARRGCGTFGNKDCFVCIRKSESKLDASIARAETHPSPTFLTPPEAEKEAN